MKNSNSYVSVIVPCYNEAGNIMPLINEIHNELSFVKHQVLVIDDNSPDGTFAIVKNANLDYVKPILRTTDPSLAKSIRKGLEEADGNIFVIMDSDFNHQPKYLPFMVKNLEYYDCIVASRFMYGGFMDSRIRQLLSWLFNVFVRIVTRKFVTDSLYGYIAIKKNTLEKIDYNSVFWGYGDYCIRLMFYLQENKENILQYPAVNGKRLSGEANGSFIKVFWQYTVETIRLVLGQKVEK